MPKSLVIVESPSKAKTINRYLGTDYVVKSSLGHVRDLPTGKGTKSTTKGRGAKKSAAANQKSSSKTKSQNKNISSLGIDPENNWQAYYEILPEKRRVVSELKTLAKDADSIFLATDMDREGEAIAWHIQEVIGGSAKRYQRVIFNEITKNAIQSAFKKPTKVDMSKVNAQQTRRFLDRIVGFKLSPLLWKKVARGLSAGRVQSTAVRLIVEREREIRAFISKEYWEIFVLLNPAKGSAKESSGEAPDALKFELITKANKKLELSSEAETNQVVDELKLASFVVAKTERKLDRNNKPGPPFITSTLQQAASSRLGFSVKNTMAMAQKLYEAGHITYMRTDSTSLSADSVKAARDLILKKFGKNYLPPKPIFYKSKAQAQEAHEAIRPSDVNRLSRDLTNVTEGARRLYELIWRQFLACQMPNAEYDLTTVIVHAGDYQLRIRGRVQRFDGYMKVKPSQQNKEDRELPDIKEGTELDLKSIAPLQRFTKPPSRYREASLVQKLEKCGIGRPSTYASIISTIQDRGYVSIRDKRFYSEKVGEVVTDRLIESFPNLMDYNFTATLEQQLDEIADGKLAWSEVLDAFYKDFDEKLTVAAGLDSGMKKNSGVVTGMKCPDCARNLQVKTASTGIFLGCEGYALPEKERCRKTINLIPEDELVIAKAEDEEDELKVLRLKKRCKLCQSAVDGYLVDKTRKLHLCSNSPACLGFEIEEGNFELSNNSARSIDCDKCGGQMNLESGRFGKYFKCTNTNCVNTRKLMRNGQPAPPKMLPIDMPELKCQKVDDYYVLRDGLTGLFLAAKQFPKHREIRQPKLQELLSHKDEIDPKYAFLYDAPLVDPDNNPSIVKFFRKTSEHYLASEKNGRPTSWRAYYQKGKWKEGVAKPTRKSARKRS